MSASKPVFEGLVKVRHWMEACLEALETASPADAGFQAAWTQLEDEFASLGPVDELKDRIDPSEEEELRSRLEEVTRLHAVLTTVVDRRRGEICDALQTTRDLRKRLDFYSGSSGDACDVEG